jgi:hypothetical protein
MMKVQLAVAIGALVTGSAVMAAHPVQLSLTPEIALYNRDATIEGLTVGIWSENPQTAVALGIVNGSTGRSAGLSWAWLLNFADNYKGIQLAPVNYVKGDFLGWQSGVINYTDGTAKGLQTGFFNYAGRLTGLQLGVVNYAETAEAGIQIGLVNLIPQNEWFAGLPNELAPGMIFVNWRF